jgi:hypothetical protein
MEAMAWIPSQGAALQYCAHLVWVCMEGSYTQEDGWELHFVTSCLAEHVMKLRVT